MATLDYNTVRPVGAMSYNDLTTLIVNTAPGSAGIQLGVQLNAADLNTITTPGLYRQSNSSGSDSPLSNNYPYNGGYGVLWVTSTNGIGNDTVQTFYPQSYSGTLDARVIYTRNKSNSVWSPWRIWGSTRFDQTVGRTLYGWNHITNNEQLLYGDTGQRDVVADAGWIAALTSAGVVDFNSGNIARLRRVGYECELVVAIDKPASGSVSMAQSFPLGFRPSQQFSVLGSNSGFVIVRAFHGGGTTGLNWNTTAAAIAASITFKYTTVDPWPTSLPGSAVGGIPAS